MAVVTLWSLSEQTACWEGRRVERAYYSGFLGSCGDARLNSLLGVSAAGSLMGLISVAGLRIPSPLLNCRGACEAARKIPISFSGSTLRRGISIQHYGPQE